MASSVPSVSSMICCDRRYLPEKTFQPLEVTERVYKTKGKVDQFKNGPLQSTELVIYKQSSSLRNRVSNLDKAFQRATEEARILSFCQLVEAKKGARLIIEENQRILDEIQQMPQCARLLARA